MDMTNFGKVDYKNTETPQGYVCSKCRATDCKLWIDYQTFLENQHLLCAPCAAKEQEKDISTMDNEGRYESKHGIRTDSIGWLVPAVPTIEGDSFWGYCAIFAKGLKWWKNLPTFPVKK